MIEKNLNLCPFPDTLWEADDGWVSQAKEFLGSKAFRLSRCRYCHHWVPRETWRAQWGQRERLGRFAAWSGKNERRSVFSTGIGDREAASSKNSSDARGMGLLGLGSLANALPGQWLLPAADLSAPSSLFPPRECCLGGQARCWL